MSTHPAARPWPVVIVRLVEAIVEVSRRFGVHGRVSVRTSEHDGQRTYWVVLGVAASETVSARAYAEAIVPPPLPCGHPCQAAGGCTLCGKCGIHCDAPGDVDAHERAKRWRTS
jgi:hypothetical protein